MSPQSFLPASPDGIVVAPGYESVAAAFFQSISQGQRSGAALSVWVHGAPVVELFGGAADEIRHLPFRSDTLVNVFSCTKGMASVLVAMLVEEGSLPGYDVPLTDVWPEFGAHGKDRITIGDVLAHRGGVSAPRFELTPEQILDPLQMAEILAAQEPLWNPGVTHQYHGITHGALTAKLVTLATGRDIGSVFAERIAQPLSADVWIGLPPSEHGRLARLLPEVALAPTDRTALPPAEIAGDPITYLSGERWLDPVVLQAQIPGAGGIATASGLARIWSSTVVPTQGLRLLTETTVEKLRQRRSYGPSLLSGPPPYQAWGAGVMVPSNWEPYLSSSSFGHDGAGGQVAFADPTFRVGFGYVTNQMGGWERGQSIVAALRAVLGATASASPPGGRVTASW